MAGSGLLLFKKNGQQLSQSDTRTTWQIYFDTGWQDPLAKEWKGFYWQVWKNN